MVMAWWQYQQRREERDAQLKRRTVNLEPTPDVWKGIEVKEHKVSETARHRILKLFGRGK